MKPSTPLPLQEQKSDNELIAEFYGAMPDRATSGGRRLWSLVNLPEFCKQIDVPKSRIRVFYAEDLEFDRSWDWLMPACKKWDDLYLNDPVLADRETNEYAYYVDLCDDLDNAVGRYEIKAVYDQMVQNIKWYNSQKP